MKGSHGKTVASMNRRIKDKIVGQMVLIIAGQFKGYKGRVCSADDKQAIIELSSNCKKVPIDRTMIDTEINK